MPFARLFETGESLPTAGSMNSTTVPCNFRESDLHFLDRIVNLFQAGNGGVVDACDHEADVMERCAGAEEIERFSSACRTSGAHWQDGGTLKALAAEGFERIPHLRRAVDIGMAAVHEFIIAKQMREVEDRDAACRAECEDAVVELTFERGVFGPTALGVTDDCDVNVPRLDR